MTEQDHTQPVTDTQRRAQLDTAVSREIMAGAKLVHRADYEAVVAYGGGAIHLVGVLITAGLWLLLYPAWRERRYVLSVNDVGRVWRRHVDSDQWERVDG